MKLYWTACHNNDLLQDTTGDKTQHVIHQSSFNGSSTSDIPLAISACVDKACDLLENGIRDDSRFMLFGWDANASTLTIVVTDDDKVRDSRDVVQCEFITDDHQLDPEDIQFWIKDYLTTCSQFLRYSLIAAFHRESRATCTLL
ncbi:hypothetical protein [Microbulbifer sp. ALW1]|uniref:hypothetical protein n=1 Tax=Microbulbifer sp. (strain ALW1) TaxID=1516059 RepID=UPI00135AB547|nr:hypothetical protein [Microbulbifer sp. ALW1]